LRFVSFVTVPSECLFFLKFLSPSAVLFRFAALSATRDEPGTGLDRTGSGLKPILAGSRLVLTAIFFKIGGSGLDRTAKMFVVLM